jgi:glycerophosphoryl diester phosphodiesterase
VLRRTVLLVAALGAAAALPNVTVPASHASDSAAPSVLVFGHRGAAGYRPEHTLASYDLAARMGADVIEPDLVPTKDHQLVARHENNIAGTTDVAKHPEFASLKKTKVIDGETQTGWFTEDFTLAQLETLRAVERLPGVREENTLHDGRYRIPTLQQVIDLAAQDSKRFHRLIGIAPETKHPSYFDSIGLSLEEPLVQTLRKNNLDRKDSGVYLQSFEAKNLRELRHHFGLKVHMVQLTSDKGGPTGDPSTTYAQMTTPAGLRDVATYADWLGPDKNQIFPRDANDATGQPTTLIHDAHAAGLKVVPYTFRAENQFLPAQYRHGSDPAAYGDVLAELRDYLNAGMDGFFTDQADLGFTAREDFLGYHYSVAHPEAKAS